MDRVIIIGSCSKWGDGPVEIVDFPSYTLVDLSIVIMVIIHGILIWLVVQCAHPEKWWSSSMARMTSHILWKIKNVWNQPGQNYTANNISSMVCWKIHNLSNIFLAINLNLWISQPCLEHQRHTISHGVRISRNQFWAERIGNGCFLENCFPGPKKHIAK